MQTALLSLLEAGRDDPGQVRRCKAVYRRKIAARKRNAFFHRVRSKVKRVFRKA